jgi:hypothetical protein
MGSDPFLDEGADELVTEELPQLVAFDHAASLLSSHLE